MKAIFFALASLITGCTNRNIINIKTQTPMKETVELIPTKEKTNDISGLCVEMDSTKVYEFQKGELSVFPFNCVDGRPDMNFGEESIRRFGAGVGFIVDLTTALNLYKSEVSDNDIEMIYKVVKNRLKDKLLYHTDNHNHESECGCGYLNFALNLSKEEFGITEANSKKIKSYLLGTQCVVVEGEHLEKGVVKMHKNEFVKKVHDNEYFVWHCDLDDIALRYLALDLAKELGLDSESFLEKAFEARDKNVGLAVKGLKADQLPQIEILQ